MAGRWKRLGRLFSPGGQHPWMASHASNPTAEVLASGLVRIYFSVRDAQNRSHITAAIFELQPKPVLVDLDSAPLIAPGAAGLFDDSGASMGCLARAGSELYLYYLGWNLGVTVPWRNSIGLAISTDNGRTFTKASPAPVLDRSHTDPFSLSYPWVLREAGGWRMWYGSNLRWGPVQSDMDHVLKYAESDDGRNWRRDGRIALPLSAPGEYALARPCVVRDPGVYRMWFTHRGPNYRLGYAESADGMSWRRDDASHTLDVADSGWDSEMVTYPCVFDCGGARYLLYNGNRYGKDGFGLAILE